MAHGPLGGIFTAMKWAKDNNKSYKWIASFPSDTPFFKKNILNNFFEKLMKKRVNYFL